MPSCAPCEASVKKLVICAAFVASSCHGTPAIARDTSALSWCSTFSEDAARLACFDRLAKEASAVDAAPAPTAPPAKAATQQPSTDTAAIIYKKIDAEDLYASPGKYEGKPIQIDRVRCYHADKDEYRCVSSGSVTLMILTIDISPTQEKALIENECGEIKKMATSSRCLKSIKFTPLKHDEDIISGYKKRVVVLSKQLEVTSVNVSNRR